MTVMEMGNLGTDARYTLRTLIAWTLLGLVSGGIVMNGVATHDVVKGSEQYYLTKVVAPLKHKAAVERAKAVTATKDKEAICNVAVANGDIQTLTDAKRCMPELGKP